MMIKENLEFVKQNIEQSCFVSNRNKEDVTLIAVSKTKPISMLQEAYALGCRDFGENKVQEIVDKYDQMPKDTRFHMIGHLQKNKVKYIVDKVVLIHSVDSLELAEKISIEAMKKEVVVSILVEVNIAKEESKFGIDKSEAICLVEAISKLPNILILGLMTIVPIAEKQEENRPYFQMLYQLSVDIVGKNIDNVSMNVLSMGMTGDYCIAIEEGSTMVRIGTGIFGEREYNID